MKNILFTDPIFEEVPERAKVSITVRVDEPLLFRDMDLFCFVIKDIVQVFPIRECRLRSNEPIYIELPLLKMTRLEDIEDKKREVQDYIHELIQLYRRQKKAEQLQNQEAV